MTLETRITELESRVAFQEDAIDQLSDTVARQAKEIDTLTRMIKILNKNLESLSTGSVIDGGSEPPPPHY